MSISEIQGDIAAAMENPEELQPWVEDLSLIEGSAQYDPLTQTQGGTTEIAFKGLPYGSHAMKPDEKVQGEEWRFVVLQNQLIKKPSVGHRVRRETSESVILEVYDHGKVAWEVVMGKVGVE